MTSILTPLAARLDQLRYVIAAHGVHLDYEKFLEDHYTRWVQPGDTIVDVGAHVGRHLSKLLESVGDTGRVLAFEPLPFAFQILKQTFSRPNVALHNLALSDTGGWTEFIHAEGTPEESGLRTRIYNHPEQAKPKKITVQIGMLDDHLEQCANLTFIKIDTEGGEIGCLRGSGKVIEKYRPLISVEYGYPSYSAYGHQKSTLFDLAQSHNYILYDIVMNSLEKVEDWNIACDSIYWDYFMVPREKEPEFLHKLRK